ncbi:MAG: iron ABC transporter permease [Acidimicrobiia bacterium]|nr:iron ABC transporter permease [Acidimicrobiia bacterium]
MISNSMIDRVRELDIARERSRRTWTCIYTANANAAAVAVAVAVAFLAPLAYLVVRVVGEGSGLDAVVDRERSLRALGNSLRLAGAVSLTAAIIGTGLAWLTTRSDVPLRRLWAVLAPLPLVVPSFVGAAALLAAVAPGGLVDELAPGLGVDRLPEVEGFGGAWFVLTLFTYPYVYLPVAARLASLSPSLEESARLLGRRPAQVFRTVVLPQAATAIWAGTLLVFLYVVSDFGAVAQLRYRTLTVEIFDSRLFNQPEALFLGLVLAVVALAVVALERRAQRRRSVVEVARAKRALVVPLGRWRWPATAMASVVAVSALLGPLAVLGYWSVRGYVAGDERARPDLGELVEPAVATGALGLGAAALTIAVVLPVAYLTSRYRSRLGGVVNAAVVGGFALPGLIVALAAVYWTLQGPTWTARFYQTVPMLLAAYAIHFGAQGLRAAQVAVGAVPRRLDDAARTLGAGRWRRLRTVELPLMVPGLLAGAGLVMLSTMKELPATLLLRPTTFDTLAVHVWSARENARWADTGTAALVLVGVSGVLTWLLVLRHAERLD